MAQTEKKRRRGPKPKGFPTPPKEKEKAIRRLSQEIDNLGKHFASNPVQFRDGRAKKSLERKIQRRNEMLVALQEQDPQAYQKLITELQEGGLL